VYDVVGDPRRGGGDGYGHRVILRVLGVLEGGAGTAGQRDRRTLRRHRPTRTPRPHSDPQPAARRPPCSTSTSTTAIGHTAQSARPLPYDHSPSRPRTRQQAFDGATSSVDCSPSISRSRDMRSASGTHRQATDESSQPMLRQDARSPTPRVPRRSYKSAVQLPVRALGPVRTSTYVPPRWPTA
jgi:hypothetical protein